MESLLGGDDVVDRATASVLGYCYLLVQLLPASYTCMAHVNTILFFLFARDDVYVFGCM